MVKQTEAPPPIASTPLVSIPNLKDHDHDIEELTIYSLPIPTIEELIDPEVVFELGDKILKWNDNLDGWVAWVDDSYSCFGKG
ncbi:hypothetical protein SUGI_1072140 [Cryptomeria japonica]|nr:hypothetical protein SUGI_1072140 [Cryptomeria japonica]